MHQSRRRLGSVAVTVVLLGAGMLFSTSAETARGTDLRSDGPDLIGLIRDQDARASARARSVEDLRAEVEGLTADAADGSLAVQAALPHIDLVTAAGREPVVGPGLVVTLEDAEDTRIRDGMTANDLVVHQEDLQAVVNAMWAGGAEAMMIQDQRIISTSAVRCVGNTLRLQGRVYSPPYRVVAIGDVAGMERALRASPVVSTYLQYVEVFGLGYEQESRDRIEMPAYEGPLELQHATVPGTTSPTPGDRAPRERDV